MTALEDLQAALDAYATSQGVEVTALRLWLFEPATGQRSLVTGLGEVPTVTTPPPDPPPDGWPTLVFSEDFTGDLSQFHVRNATTQANTYCNNFAANVAISGGQLVITGRAEETTVSTGSGPRTCQYSSGYIDTSGALLSIAKGSRVEIVATLPTVLGGTAKGLWPALWLRDKTGAGEIDMAEGWGEPTTTHGGYRSGSFSSTVYRDTGNAAAGKVSNWGTAVGAPAVGGVEHTFWMEWDDDGIRIGMDDQPPHVNARYATTSWLAAAFPSTLELRINLQIGDNYWGMPDDGTVFPCQFLIDSVKVYTQ